MSRVTLDRQRHQSVRTTEENMIRKVGAVIKSSCIMRHGLNLDDKNCGRQTV